MGFRSLKEIDLVFLMQKLDLILATLGGVLSKLA